LKRWGALKYRVIADEDRRPTGSRRVPHHYGNWFGALWRRYRYAADSNLALGICPLDRDCAKHRSEKKGRE
jgi:hypothetical protein